ncbi:MAG: ATP-binding protein [Candidatus Aminicenantes bacterium]|jgi:signal transduction histidine kinase
MLTQSLKNKGFFLGFLLGIGLSAIALILSFLLPSFVSSRYSQKSLDQLRKQSKAIKNEFNALEAHLELKKRIILNSPFPEDKNEIFRLFKRLNLNTEIEGIGYYTSEEGLILWQGNIADFIKTPFPEEDSFNFLKQDSSFLIKHKSSVYLAALQKVKPDNYIIIFRLMAFIPEFKTPYLKEYHFLKPKWLINCAIDYSDFRDDVSGFEKLFSRHKDEYFAQRGPQYEIRTYLFPLRNKAEKIVATISLYPLTLSAKLTGQKENFLLIFYLLLGFSLLSLLIHCVKSPLFFKERKLLPLLLVILILVGLRLIFFPLGDLEKIQSLPIFSPSSASFFSIWILTKSPADIFLTAFFLFLIAGCLGIYSRNLFKSKKRKSSLLSVPIILVFIFTSLFFMFVFQELLFRLVSHSNINLLHFSLNPSFFLLHLSIFLFLSVALFAIFTGLRIISSHSRIFLPLLILIFEFGAYFLFFKDRNSLFLFTLQFLIITLALFVSFFPKLIKRKEVLLSILLLPTLFIYASLHLSTSNRNNSLLQNSLQNIIKSQEPWGFFMLNQSFPEIDKREESIISFLQSSEPPGFAHSLWERTLPAKFNWYSSLEIIAPDGITNPDGEFLSRFSLNVPELYSADFDLPISREWSISYLNIPIMGEERDFLLGYKDWFVEENHLGRTILYLSIDYDMLPFLYSANPYFELLRVTSIPSLDQFDLGFAIFDPEGRLIFNPNNISSGIPPAVLEKIDSQDSLWSVFTDKRKKFHSFYFKKNHRIYSLFIPKKNFFNFSTEFMRLFFFYLAISLLFFILSAIGAGKRFKNPLWSFSNRVYISFVAIALIPLLLFTFLTRNFFAQIFTQQFTEKAEIHANFVRRVMEDFMITQQEEMVSLITPPETVVLEISSIISSDVNLYQDGRITSSSRREFFDSGLIPDLIDGEIYYKIQYENNPYYTQTQKIGGYSFHTLTTSYSLGDSLLLISLPFPLEQQEISKATDDLIEFLFFISVFFIAVVLGFARGIGHMIVTPIRKLLMGTKEVSSGNLEISIPHKPQDEMKTLIDGFNTMIKNLKKHQQELTDMGKKVAWAEMARKVAHEIKNPLTPIQLSAEHLLRVYKDKKKNFDKALQESASYIITEVENLRKIAQEFLETSKEVVIQKEPLDLKKLLQETVAPYKNMISERIGFKEEYEGRDFQIVGDRSRMMIALRNIFINAIEAIQGKGEIEIIVSEEKNRIRLEIRDTGIGIGKEMLDRIFESNFSTKDMGTGLGLPISKKIIEEHGGSIHASSKEKEGTQIFIDLPK